MPHMATVRATEEARLYCVEADEGFLQDRPEITYHLSKMLAQRLHGVTSYLVDVKRQFEGADNHLEMVDEVLETLVNEQVEEFSPGSDRDPDVKL
jgi:CRP/FNR family cyclic AMP-dependent transcriptional regulator